MLFGSGEISERSNAYSVLTRLASQGINRDAVGHIPVGIIVHADEEEGIRKGLAYLVNHKFISGHYGVYPSNDGNYIEFRVSLETEGEKACIRLINVSNRFFEIDKPSFED